MSPGSSAFITLSTDPLDGPANSPPEADLSAPASAVQGQPITLDASGSSDPDGDALAFAWDLDDDGAYDDATGATVQHGFADAGVQTVGVEVSDGTDTDTADATIEVAHYAPVDVKPGSDDNPVNPKARGVLPVAILNTDDFDPTAVVVESLRLSATEGDSGASPAHGGHFEDVDGDGDDDLVVHFSSAGLGLDSETSTLYLRGEMVDGLSLVGSGDVTVVGTDKRTNGNGNGRGR
jgi:PKD repeat protein